MGVRISEFVRTSEMGVVVAVKFWPRSLHSQLWLMVATRVSSSAMALSVSIHSVVGGHHVYKKLAKSYEIFTTLPNMVILPK